MKPYIYVLIRKDISIAQQLVQVGHAAREAALAFPAAPDEPIASIIVCEVPDREALLEASERLTGYGVEHSVFFEPDFGMGESALATRSVFQKKERYVFRKYPLYCAGHPGPALKEAA
jgi:hypothetical protein